MSRLNLEDNKLHNSTIMRGLKLASITKTLGADFTMSADLPPLITLDPGGAGRKVMMPSETDEKNFGLTFIIRNGANAAVTLTFRDSGDTTTMGTALQNEAVIATLAPAVAGAATYSWLIMAVPKTVVVDT